MSLDLILWRHADAEDQRQGFDDLQRALAPRGEKQAGRMAQWLEMLCSPALRCEQTILPLGRKYKLREELAPDNNPNKLLAASDWPEARQPVLMVGHQPMLGQVVAKLIGVKAETCLIRKGAFW